MLSVEHVTEMLEQINVHTGPRNPGMTFWIKQPFVARTVGEGHSCFPSLQIPIDLRYLPQGRFALITRHLDDCEGRGIGMTRTQEFVIPTEFIDGLLREGHPTIGPPTEKLLMQTAIAQRHTYPRIGDEYMVYRKLE